MDFSGWIHGYTKVKSGEELSSVIVDRNNTTRKILNDG